MGEKSATPDLVIARIACGQHGMVAMRQLDASGIGRNAVALRVRAGRLYRVHRGVYAVGHMALSSEARWMGAVLACGRGGLSSTDKATESVLGYWGVVLSHRSAAELWQLLPCRDEPIDVTVSGTGGKRKRRGIRLHRSSTLTPAAVTLRAGIPVTKPERTIADLRHIACGRSPLVSPWELRRAIRQANVLELPIGAVDSRDRTRSDLERDFLLLCRRYRVPPPEVNVRVGPYLVDFLWRDQGVVVETDGYLYHRGREIFQDDRARGLHLRALGFVVIPLSEKQVDEEAVRVAEVLRDALRVGADADRVH